MKVIEDKDLVEAIEHFGIRGMKWGVRRSRGSGGTVGGTSPREHAKSLSDEDLMMAISRMELEQRYSKLLTPEVKKSNGEGAAFAKDLGKTFVKNAFNTVGNEAIKLALAKAMKK